MRNRLYQESHIRPCQEIQESRRICCEETDRARQARIDELSVHQKRNPTTVSQLLTRIWELQNKVNSLSDATEFHDPETASSSGARHVPSQPSTIPSPRTTPCCDSGLPHDTRNIVGTSGNVFDSLLAREGPSSAFFVDPENLTSSSCGLRSGNTGNTMRHGEGLRREPQCPTKPTSRFTRNYDLCRARGNYSQNCVSTISELHFGKFPNSGDLNVGESTLRPKCV